jgi:hypothetical protein
VPTTSNTCARDVGGLGERSRVCETVGGKLCAGDACARVHFVSPQFNCRGWVLLHSGSIRARRHACLSHVSIERLRVSRRRMLGSEVAATLVARSVRV